MGVQSIMRVWFEFEAIGTDGDHVHLFWGAAPRYSTSRIMQIIKKHYGKRIVQSLS